MRFRQLHPRQKIVIPKDVSSRGMWGEKVMMDKILTHVVVIGYTESCYGPYTSY